MATTKWQQRNNAERRKMQCPADQCKVGYPQQEIHSREFPSVSEASKTWKTERYLSGNGLIMRSCYCPESGWDGPDELALPIIWTNRRAEQGSVERAGSGSALQARVREQRQDGLFSEAPSLLLSVWVAAPTRRTGGICGRGGEEDADGGGDEGDGTPGFETVEAASDPGSFRDA